MNSFISIDPSGMGKNGLFSSYFKNEIQTYQSKNWLDTFTHLIFYIDLMNEIYIEDIKYTFDKVGLETITTIKLIGLIEEYCISHNIKIIRVTSDMVKSRAKWFKDILLIQPNKKGEISKRDQRKIDFCKLTEITWEKNKYFYKGNKIDAHQRDAILIYFIGNEINNDSRNNY